MKTRISLIILLATMLYGFTAEAGILRPVSSEDPNPQTEEVNLPTISVEFRTGDDREETVLGINTRRGSDMLMTGRTWFWIWTEDGFDRPGTPAELSININGRNEYTRTSFASSGTNTSSPFSRVVDLQEYGRNVIEFIMVDEEGNRASEEVVMNVLTPVEFYCDGDPTNCNLEVNGAPLPDRPTTSTPGPTTNLPGTATQTPPVYQPNTTDSDRTNAVVSQLLVRIRSLQSEINSLKQQLAQSNSSTRQFRSTAPTYEIRAELVKIASEVTNRDHTQRILNIVAKLADLDNS